jgi:hypothetical protein
MAMEQQQKYKIPASITLAQGLLESGAGRSRLATVANNHINDYKETIENIHNMDWENPDANKLATSNFLCQWCDYCGSRPNRGGFMGCPASKDFMTNNAIFTLKS